MRRRVAGSVAQPAGVTSPAARVEPGETIAAISTPVGEGAIAVVRISGENAIAVADCIFRGKEEPSQFPSHAQRLGGIVQDDRVIDQENGHDPGRGGHGFDPGADRSRAAFRQRTT
ncbi:MAG: hypothetical protein LC627_01095 [Verrucomicrobiaceae bacterium]|nr:hypothetical protein [Verrucomicrobiaceae bacterium]